MTAPTRREIRNIAISVGVMTLTLLLVGLLHGCATLSEAEKAGIALCKLNQQARDPVKVAVCDSLDVASDWITVASLAAAKPDVSAAKEALIAHPPLSAAANAALALPCIEQPKPIDDANPYYGPQSRIERRLYPPIVMAPPARGE